MNLNSGNCYTTIVKNYKIHTFPKGLFSRFEQHTVDK